MITVMTVSRLTTDDEDHGTPSDVTLRVIPSFSDLFNYPTYEPVFECKGMELPWRDNQRMISRVPEGTYLATRVNSPKFGWCYLLQDVPGRSAVLFGHIGNYGGDEEKGYRSNSDGCLLLGTRHGILTPNGKAQLSVLSSKPVVDRFRSVVLDECTEGAIVIITDPR